MDTNYYSNQYYVNSSYNHANPAIILSLFLFSIAFALIIYAVYAWLLGRIFNKAGISKTIAWIPFYNVWKMLELGDQRGFWAILTVVPFVNYIAAIFIFISQYKIGLKFGKEGWWVVLAIFVPIIWLALLAFDSSKWEATPAKIK